MKASLPAIIATLASFDVNLTVLASSIFITMARNPPTTILTTATTTTAATATTAATTAAAAAAAAFPTVAIATVPELLLLVLQ